MQKEKANAIEPPPIRGFVGVEMMEVPEMRGRVTDPSLQSKRDVIGE